MDRLTTPEGSLALAIAALLLVLGFRFARPERASGWIAFAAYGAALAASLLGARGLLPGAAFVPGAPVRIGGAALLVAGLLLAGRATKPRRTAPPGAAAGGPRRRVRRPVEPGLALVLLGHLLRAPSSLGAGAVAVAVALLLWSARRATRGAEEARRPT